MEFKVDPSIQLLFPHLTIGIVSGSISGGGLRTNDLITEFRKEAVSALHSKVPSTDELTSHPHIGEWRKAYQAFGVKAKKHKPTHEALARRILKDGEWPDINPIVDVYLTNQITHLLPHGGYDAAVVRGPLCLTTTRESESFEPLGGGEEFTSPGEVVYRDSTRILTRRWNYRDCDAAKITDNTTQFTLMLESPSPQIKDASLEAAAADLVSRYGRCYEGIFSYKVFRPWREELSIQI